MCQNNYFKEDKDEKFRNLLAVVLVVVLAVNLCLADYRNVKADEGETVYLDGIEFTITYDDDMNMVIKGDAVDSLSESELILNKDGTATVMIDNEGCEQENYSLDIEEMDGENDFEATVFDENIDVVAEYDNYDQLEEDIDAYEGQTAISAGGVVLITIGLTLAVLILWGLAKIISGVVYLVATKFYSAVQSLAKSKRAKAYNYYYPAYIVGKKTFISPSSISTSRAASRIKNGLCVYSFTSYLARQVVIAAGYNHWPSGTTGDVTSAKNRKSGGIYFYHYHKATSTGHGTEHSFYGAPIIG